MMIDTKLVKKLKIYAYILFAQFGSAGFAIVAKAALNQGSSHFTFSVYRNVIAAVIFTPFALFFESKARPKMTLSVFVKILILSLSDPIIGQNLYYAGMKYLSPTFTLAMFNIFPALAFLLAWILRIEKVNFRDVRSHAKLAGILVTVGGAMIMTLIVGPVIKFPWTHKSDGARSSMNQQDPIKGSIMISISCLGYSMFYIVQEITLRSYPAALSLTALICTFGAILGTVLTFVVERGNTQIWALGWNTKLLACAYGGIVSSGLTYYTAGVVMKEKGAVFVTSFNPLNMVIVAVLSSFIFAEQMNVGLVSGAMVIVIGLYLVIWGKSKDWKELEKLNQQQEKLAAKDVNLIHPPTKTSKDHDSQTTALSDTHNAV